MIKELTELVTLADRTLPNHVTILNLLSKNNGDVLRLFYAVQANKFRTEAEAIEKSKVGERTKFRQVAKELLRCLEQMALLIDFDKQVLDDFNHARIRGFQLMSMAKTLGPQACKNAAKKVADELLKVGQQYARPEFVLEAAKVFMDYVTIVGDDLKAFDTYLNLYEAYDQWRRIEERSNVYLTRINLFYAKKKALQTPNLALSEQYINELEKFVNVIPSHTFHVNFYCLKAKSYMIATRYQEASMIYESAIQYFQNRPYTCKETLSIFYYLEVANCVYLGKYQRGQTYFNKAVELAQIGSVNWYNTLELGFYLRMYEQDYAGAAALFQEASKNKRFTVLRETQRETWHILGAYLYIMQKLSGTELPEGMVPKVKSSKFRNEIKDFSHDKMGMNIAILAAEVLLDFVEEKDDELWDRIAALEKYRERYLRNHEETHRSQLFIKILSILSKYHYDRDKFLDKAAPYLAEMRRAPLQLSNQAHELEIVPYEQLIHAIASHLNRRWGSKTELPAWLNAVGPRGSGMVSAAA